MTPSRSWLSRVLPLVLALGLLAGPARARPLHVLVTGDMHGWMQPQTLDGETLGGAAETLARWKRDEKLRPSDFLVLSAGDVATGPALSSVYKGVPAVETMNAMGYDASALGNHEFDFGMDQLQVLGKLARFPFLAANVLQEGGGDKTLVPSFVVLDKGGLKVGVLGLITRDLKGLSLVKGLQVTDYVEALRRAAAQARARGAQILLVVAHVPLSELVAAASQVADLGIPLMMGGHSHELGQAQEKTSGTWVVNSGEWWKAYSRVDLDYDPGSGRTTVLSLKQVAVRARHPARDAKVAALVASWQAKLDADPKVGKILGYLAQPLDRFWPLSNFICDAWLAMDPESDLALVNAGALRQDLPAGPLNRAALIGVLPFNDELWRLSLTGKELLDYLPKDQNPMGMAGLKRQGRNYVLTRTGKALDPRASYNVLLNNYMVETSPLLKAADSAPVTVDKDWRDSLERWLLQQPSSADKPLTGLDPNPRL